MALAFASSALAGRAAIVTGGASGIGAATARVLASMGATVAILDVTSSEEVADEIRRTGGVALARLTDVSALDQLEGVVAETEAALGPVTILVNNAAVTGSNLLDTSLASW